MSDLNADENYRRERHSDLKKVAQGLREDKDKLIKEIKAKDAEIERLKNFVKKIAKHDFDLVNMCPHKVHEDARKLLGWSEEESKGDE